MTGRGGGQRQEKQDKGFRHRRFGHTTQSRVVEPCRPEQPQLQVHGAGGAGCRRPGTVFCTLHRSNTTWEPLAGGGGGVGGLWREAELLHRLSRQDILLSLIFCFLSCEIFARIWRPSTVSLLWSLLAFINNTGHAFSIYHVSLTPGWSPPAPTRSLHLVHCVFACSLHLHLATTSPPTLFLSYLPLFFLPPQHPSSPCPPGMNWGYVAQTPSGVFCVTAPLPSMSFCF